MIDGARVNIHLSTRVFHDADNNDMSHDYHIPITLLDYLGSCIYGDPKSYYIGLNEDKRAELEVQGKNFGMTAWLYRYLCDVLPETKRTEYQKIYYARQVKALMSAKELNRLYSILSVHNLRFVPIKGADLAYRLYPDAALRTFNDWDIWFHPDDCEHALSVLTGDGWEVEYSSKDHEAIYVKGTHHFSAFIRGQHIIEPHFTLANFEDIAPYKMWEYTMDHPANNGARILSPEMNLLMLTRHAATKSYYHAQIPKLLTDAAMVMKEKVDFDKLRKMSTYWGLPYPGDFLAAFPEFFPATVIERFDANPERAEAFRKIFELRGELGEQDFVSLSLGRYEVRSNVFCGLLKRFRALNQSAIRSIYHLPKHSAWWRVVWAYMCWFCSRSRRALTWIQRKPVFQDYVYLVDRVESGGTYK